MAGSRCKRRMVKASSLLLILAGCGEAPAAPDIGVKAADRSFTASVVPAISVADARTMLDSGAVLVDVREPAELQESGSLQDAINRPMSTFAKRADRLPRDRPIILYCRSGRRSAIAGDVLRSMGFSQVHNLGGFEAAADAGWPTIPGG